MAVEAQHHHHSTFIPSHLMPNRDFIKGNQANVNMYNTINTQMGSGNAMLPLPENNNPTMLYQFEQTQTSMNQAESGLTYNVISTAPRKRPRETTSLMNEFHNFPTPPHKKPSSIFDQDIAFQIQRQQSEIDTFIAQHTEKVRLELAEQRRRESRMLVTAIQDRILKKLQEKEDEIQKIHKLNWALQERVKTLFVENQLWRDLAQSNEAAANSLRSNLEQVLAHVSEEGPHNNKDGNFNVEDDAGSCCGSNDENGGGGGGAHSEVGGGDRMCKRCGVMESNVLVLPCRHLCLCTMCGSTLQKCPVCDSVMNASVRVNFS